MHLGEFVLFADDTNIFVAEKCKVKVVEKATATEATEL